MESGVIMSAENSESLAVVENQVAEALVKINNLSIDEIDTKIETIENFIKESETTLLSRIADLKKTYGRQIALLRAARESI